MPAAKWLGFNVVAWGIATACGAAARNYTTLLVSRIALGVFEATIGPSLMLISSQYYSRKEQGPRFSFWYLGLGLGQITGGAVSYGFQHVTGGGMAGWRIMFVTLGMITVVVGLCTFAFLPDTPMKARWMTDAEKVALLKHVSVNQTGIDSKKFRPKQILEALMDPQMWLMTLSVVLVRLPLFRFANTFLWKYWASERPKKGANKISPKALGIQRCRYHLFFHAHPQPRI